LDAVLEELEKDPSRTFVWAEMFAKLIAFAPTQPTHSLFAQFFFFSVV
jgi:hypothetical protein